MDALSPSLDMLTDTCEKGTWLMRMSAEMTSLGDSALTVSEPRTVDL